MSKLRVVYWGSSVIGLPTLDLLASESSEFELCGIVTREDSPAGRNMQLCSTPVKEHALHRLPDNKCVSKIEHHHQINDLKKKQIPLLTPKYIRGNKELRSVLSALRADIFVVISYGHILTNLILERAKWAVCVHTSSLPRLRGPSPVRSAIALGLDETEICTFLMTPRMDDGDILVRRLVPISNDMLFPELCNEFSKLAPDIVAKSLNGLRGGTLEPEPQAHMEATYTRLITKSDTWIDWNEDALAIRNRARALNPDPCLTTTFRGKRVKFDMPIDIVETSGDLHAAGEILTLEKSGVLHVACGRNSLSIKRIQPESKPWMTSRDFINGFAPSCGEMFITDNADIIDREPFESPIPRFLKSPIQHSSIIDKG